MQTVTSSDGARIACQTVGQGPALVIVHGSLSTHRNYSRLVDKLAETFTVTIYDRRGFGESAYDGAVSMEQDLDDLACVVEAAACDRVFGYSLGGIIALAGAVRMPGVRKLAFYEPPLFPSREAAAPSWRASTGSWARARPPPPS